jgi:acyl-CoA thioesterase
MDLMRRASLSEPAWQLLGLELLEVAEGYAKVRLALKPEYRNFFGTIHGGIIMTLADSAFGYAVNSVTYPTVAAHFNTQFLSPALESDILVAECRVLKAGRRAVMAEVQVNNQAGKLIAIATGTGIPVNQQSVNLAQAVADNAPDAAADE